MRVSPVPVAACVRNNLSAFRFLPDGWSNLPVDSWSSLLEITQAFGYYWLVPTVLRKNGFDFRIYNNDHEPMHSHVWKVGKEVVINLGDAVSKPYIRVTRGMTKTEERRALKIAAIHQDFLIEEWVRINGDE